MKLNESESPESLLMRYARHAPSVTLLDYIKLGFIKRQNEYIVLYRDDDDVCTPYIVQHLTDSGLHYGRYYSKAASARQEFARLQHSYGGVKMIEIKDELNAAPVNDWQCTPIAVNHRKWWLHWYRIGDDGRFCFIFVSPKKRKYTFFTERGKNGGRVPNACVALANGVTIASYNEDWGDKPERMDAVLRLTPKHVIDRLFVLLDAIG